MSREEMKATLERVTRLSRGHRCSARLTSSWSGNTRFAANEVTTGGSVEDSELSVQSWHENRHASVTTNDLSNAGLERAVRRAEALARIAPPDPEDMPLLGAQDYRAVDGYFETTARSTAKDMAQAALSALEVARKSNDLEAAGFLTIGAKAVGLMNTAGLFGYHPSTSTNYTLTVRTRDGTGSGFAGADHNDWAHLDFSRVGQRAMEKARASRRPVALEPGRYTTILETQAANDFNFLLLFGLDARAADEGRSPFTREGGGNRIGERVVDERVNILSDPGDPDLLGRPFDDEGLPLERQEWIKNGVLNQLVYSRFWAGKQGRQPTGRPGTLKMTPGPATLEEMIRSTDRGVLVTRLWYQRQVDPRTLLYTGLTRDGTFLIEGGRVARSIKNFRFNESPLFALKNLDSIGPLERHTTPYLVQAAMPAIKVHDFNFTSLSDAV
ncbi:MAG: TldD/PmbA family protein [Gemmatimonadales bacterium]